jgi:hypothetical protein
MLFDDGRSLVDLRAKSHGFFVSINEFFEALLLEEPNLLVGEPIIHEFSPLFDEILDLELSLFGLRFFSFSKNLRRWLTA